MIPMAESLRVQGKSMVKRAFGALIFWAASGGYFHVKTSVLKL